MVNGEKIITNLTEMLENDEFDITKVKQITQQLNETIHCGLYSFDNDLCYQPEQCSELIFLSEQLYDKLIHYKIRSIDLNNKDNYDKINPYLTEIKQISQILTELFNIDEVLDYCAEKFPALMDRLTDENDYRKMGLYAKRELCEELRRERELCENE